MGKRIRKILWVALLAFVAWIAFESISPHVRAYRQRGKVEAESLRILREASTENELREAVGELGLFVPLPDGEWVAIRYRDSHSYPGWSATIARDSQGQWWTSGKHFCGKFLNYNEETKMKNEMDKLREFDQKIPPWEPRDEMYDPQVVVLASSPTLVSAREVMEKMGIHRMDSSK